MNLPNVPGRFSMVVQGDEDQPSRLIELLRHFSATAPPQIRVWFRNCIAYFRSFSDGGPLGNSVFSGENDSGNGIQQSRSFRVATDFHSNTNYYFAPSERSYNETRNANKLDQFNQLLISWPRNLVIFTRGFNVQTNNPGTALFKLLTLVVQRRSNLNKMYTEFQRGMAQMALFPLTNMESASRYEGGSRTRAYLRRDVKDLASLFASVNWESTEIVMRDYQSIASGWNYSRTLEDFVQAWKDAEYVDRQIPQYLDRYRTRTKNVDKFERAIGYMRFITPTSRRIIEIMRKVKAWDVLNDVVERSARTPRFFFTILSRAIHNTPEAFGFTYNPIYRSPVFRSYTLDGEELFERSTVAFDNGINRVDIESIDDLHNINPNTPIVFKNNRVINDLLDERVLQGFLTPNSVFQIPCPIVFSDNLVGMTIEQISEHIANKGVGPTLNIGWIFGRVKDSSTLFDLRESHVLAAPQFPFKMFLWDNATDKRGLKRYTFDELFSGNPSCVRTSRVQGDSGNGIFSKPFYRATFTINKEVEVVKLPVMNFDELS
jgi:hypothetical protein